jgi:hypothetical protein
MVNPLAMPVRIHQALTFHQFFNQEQKSSYIRFAYKKFSVNVIPVFSRVVVCASMETIVREKTGMTIIGSLMKVG